METYIFTTLFLAAAFAVMAAGLIFSKYKRQEEEEHCFACPIRMLLNRPCKKDHGRGNDGASKYIAGD